MNIRNTPSKLQMAKPDMLNIVLSLRRNTEVNIVYGQATAWSAWLSRTALIPVQYGAKNGR